MKSKRLSSHLAWLLLILVTVGALISGGLLQGNRSLAALPDADPAITNYPSQFDGWAPGEIRQTVVPLGVLDWDITDHSCYIPYFYTSLVSTYYNGYPTPNHVVLDDDIVRIFIGYPQNTSGVLVPYCYMNMIFTDSYPLGFSSLSFTMRPLVLDFYSLSEAGFLFNGSFSGQYYTGYALILKCDNVTGMLESGVPTPNTAVFSLIYIENELMDSDAFQPGTIGSTRTLIGTYRTDIQYGSTPSFDVQVDSALDGSFQLYVDGALAADITAPQSTASGFGFYAGYSAIMFFHDDGALAVVQFEQIQMTVNMSAVSTTATVKFVDINTGDEIANEQTLTGYVGDQFKVTPPLAIEDYRYVKASLNSLDPIYYCTDPLSNVITLYYDDTAVTKSSDSGIGTSSAPIMVSVGDSIEYFVDITNTGPERPAVVITDVWCGDNRTIARDSSGDIWNWRNNDIAKNEYLSPSGANYIGAPITDIWCRYYNTIARDANGDFWVLEPWGDIDGSEIIFKDEYLSPSGANYIGVPITDIWCGYYNTIARDANGDFWVWGNNWYGQLGLGYTFTFEIVPIKNPYLSPSGANYIGAPIVDVWTGSDHVIARDANGDFWVWGYNYYGQLGLGVAGNADIPTYNAYLSETGGTNLIGAPIVDVWTGSDHVIARDANGDFWVWGYNYYGQLGLGYASIEEVVPKNPYLSPSGQPFVITDLLPEGLSLGSTLVYTITDANGVDISGDVDLIDVTVTTEGTQERITFRFLTLPSGTTRFTFTVTPDDVGFFINTADFIDRSNVYTITTNPAYHEADYTRYLVHYNPNSGSGSMADETVILGQNLTLTSNSFTRPGYTFIGWNTNANGSGTPYPNQYEFSPWALDNDLTLYAQWRVNTYTVTYLPNGGSGDQMPVDTVTFGQNFRLSANTYIHAGRIFVGWTTNPSGGGTFYTDEYLFNPYNRNSNLVLYAQWTAPRNDISYIVHYYEQDSTNSVAADKIVTDQTFGTMVTEYAIDVLGYDMVAPTELSKMIEEHNNEFIFYYIPLSYSVTVNDSYASDSGAGTYQHGLTVTIDAGSRDGYTFNGWSVISGGVTLANTTTLSTTFTMPMNDVVVKANWTAKAGSDLPSTGKEGNRFWGDPSTHWALLNLILCIIGAVVAVFSVIRALLLRNNKEQKEQLDYATHTSGEEKHTKRRWMWLLVTVTAGILGVIVFLITEDMHNPMAFIDRWTIVNTLIFLIGAIGALLAFKRQKKDKDDRGYREMTP